MTNCVKSDILYFVDEFNRYVRLAQLDRAFGYGPKGRGFESSNPRIKRVLINQNSFFHCKTLGTCSDAQVHDVNEQKMLETRVK